MEPDIGSFVIGFGPLTVLAVEHKLCECGESTPQLCRSLIRWAAYGETTPQLRQSLILRAACLAMFVGVGAIMASCPFIVSRGYWWAAPLLPPLAVSFVVAFGAVCNHSLPSLDEVTKWVVAFEAVRDHSLPSPDELTKWSGREPSGGVDDRWLDSP